MLNFSRQERAVIYFLIVTLSIGAVLKLFKDKQLTDNLKPVRFYEEEREFSEITARINVGEPKLIDSSDIVAVIPNVVYSSDSSDMNNALHMINLNTAGVDELSTLPGIGPVIAERIVAYVQANGPFKAKENVILVKGVGDKLYARIQDLVTTE
ncbi:MAG: helix-hairpin-helix domain-containing protein [Candidatus Marinimicrobia bacterium]|nr:helix-hairpin-helix domain-containing protein [Candidatus Neomarinimicrobiota bacterium]